jgi:hypothetical protein
MAWNVDPFRGLFLEEIVEGLAVAVDFGRCSSTPLLFDQNLGLEERAEIIGTLVGHPHFNRFDALIARRRVEVQAIAAGVKIGPTVFALVGCLNLIHYLDLGRAVVAPRDQVKARFHASTRTLWPWRRLGLPLTVTVLVAGLTILSIH